MKDIHRLLYSLLIVVSCIIVVVVESFVIPSSSSTKTTTITNNNSIESAFKYRFNNNNNNNNNEEKNVIHSSWITATRRDLQHNSKLHHSMQRTISRLMNSDPSWNKLTLNINNQIRQQQRSQSTTSQLFMAPTKSATLATTTTTNYYQLSFMDDNDIEKSDIVIVGGGPAGLLTGIMVAQKFATSTSGSNDQQNNNNKKQRRRRIIVIDRLNEPAGPDDDTVWDDIAKFYLIGLGGRGQTALKKFNVWDDVQRRCIPVVGRKDWSPNDPNPVERIFNPTTKRVTTQILPRDKLVSVLYEYIQQNHGNDIEFLHGYEVEPIDFFYKDSTEVLLQVTKCLPITELEYKFNNNKNGDNQNENIPPQEPCDIESARYITTKLLIGADGTVRTIANSIEKDDKRLYKNLNLLQKIIQRPKQFYVKRYVDDNQRLYKSIPFKVPADWRGDLNYSARTSGGINFDALPANNRGDYCGILLVKYNDPIVTGTAGTDNGRGILTASELRKRMDTDLPQFSKLIDDTTIEAVAQKPISQLPSFRYVTPRLHHGNNCVILGDCIHTVKPYFGLGANSALEDVKILSEIFDATNINLDDSTSIGTAIRAFTKRHAKDTKTLVRLSRDLDRPGKLGFITFLLPIILDGIFSSILPKIFNPNTITMLQREDLTFRQVARIKRRDRILQSLFLGGTVFGITKLTTTVVSYCAKLLGQRPRTVGVTIFITTLLSSYLVHAVQQQQKKKNEKRSSTSTTSTDENLEETTIKVTSSQQTFVKPVFGQR